MHYLGDFCTHNEKWGVTPSEGATSYALFGEFSRSEWVQKVGATAWGGFLWSECSAA